MRWWWVLLFLGACAEIPASVCFFDESCADGGAGGGAPADGGATGGGATGGGSATGGGDTGGGGATGGGAATGGGSATGGGAATGGGNWTRVVSTLSTLGIPETANQLTTVVPTGRSDFSISRLPAGTTAWSNCSELFRGGVVLPDGRVLAVPHCARSFILVDPLAATATAIRSAPLPPLTGPGAWGGGVLGCDGRAYLLPTRANVPFLRVTPEADAGLRFDELPVVGAALDSLTGGVVARPCDSGLLVIAAGRGGLFALDIYEEGVVSRALGPASVAGVQFSGVARVGDSFVVSAPSVQGGETVMLWANTTSVSVTDRRFPGDAGTLGVVTAADGGLFVVSPGARGWAVAPSGPTPSRVVAGASPGGVQWPAVDRTSGFVISAGASIVAWRDGVGPDAVLLADAGAGATGGGVVVTPSGTIVVLPGAGSLDVLLLTPPVPTAPGAEPLSPWFNKL